MLCFTKLAAVIIIAYNDNMHTLVLLNLLQVFYNTQNAQLTAKKICINHFTLHVLIQSRPTVFAAIIKSKPLLSKAKPHFGAFGLCIMFLI